MREKAAAEAERRHTEERLQSQQMVCDELAGEILAGLVVDMVDTLHEVGGIGLAAPQVGVGLRLVEPELEEEEAAHPPPAVAVSYGSWRTARIFASAGASAHLGEVPTDLLLVDEETGERWFGVKGNLPLARDSCPIPGDAGQARQGPFAPRTQ